MVRRGSKIGRRPFASKLSFSCRALVNPAVPQCIIIFVIRFRNPSLLGGSSLSFACSKPVVAGWIVVVVCLWVCGRCRFWGWWSYCGGYIYFTLHDGRVLLPCARALCLSMLRWFLSKGTARRRNCASMRDWALCGVGPLGIRGLHRAGSRGQEVRARHGVSLPALERRAQDH